jgi:foldase protein PrsA
VSGRRPLLAILSAFVVSALGLSACGGSSHHGIPAGAVAAVEGKGITEAEVNHWLAIASYSNSRGTVFENHPEVPLPPAYSECVQSLMEVAREQNTRPLPSPARLRRACEIQHQTLRSRALGFLLTSNWTLAEAEHLGYVPSQSEINAEYRKLKATNFPTEAALAKLLARTRQTRADLRFHAKVALAQEKIQHHILSGVHQPSQKEIAAYYAAHASEFKGQEARDVRVVLTREESQAKQALSEIRAGKSFASVAEARSIDPVSREKGGLVSGLTRTQGNPKLAEAVFAAKPGQLLGPVKTVIGYFIYEVVRAAPQRQQTLAEAKAKIKSLLFEQRAEVALKAFASTFNARWKSRTECRPGNIVPQCKESSKPVS